ncbi:MAG: aminodeoxychorismate synthase component I [Lysobacterales bacterium]|jgi:anthranilate synthase component 1
MQGACRLSLHTVPDLAGLSRACPEQFPYLLESAAAGPLGAHSILLFADGDALVAKPDGTLTGPGTGDDFFQRLREWYEFERSRATEDDHAAGPFLGGWFVFLGYEMAGRIESTLQLPVNDSGLPDAIAHRCRGAIVVHHAGGAGETDRAEAVGESPAVLEAVLQALDDAIERLKSGRAGRRAPALQALEEEDPKRFRRSVRRIHGYLEAGDVFQVNISREWSGTFEFAPDATDLYESLRLANPAPFAGMMRWEGLCLLSSSPERLVQVHGRKVQARPIAGTRPRGDSELHDRTLSDELISNLKERAEHVMLIDLERNDLGRVCRPGSIEVNELMVVESYAHVHHIVSNVRGELRADAGPVDVIRAVFPGGTITGCPKVRCMEIIAELEGRGRGFYTGSMGYLGLDGGMDLNILIRSMLLDGQRFSFRTGAGIVADSDPQQEVLETADKARGLLRAVEVHGKEVIHA